MIYVYTSILNGWDNLRPPAFFPANDVQFVCFTNVPNLPKVAPWEYRPLYDVGEACRTARVPKILPHLMLPPSAEYSIYCDGNLQLRIQPVELIVETLKERDWAAHRHPARDCIYAEADVILDHESMKSWREQNPSRAPRIWEEVERYKKQNYPVGAGLWANGMIVRRHTPAVAALNEAWWKLYAAGGERDQLSFPVARRAQNLEVKTIEHPICAGPYVNFWFHAAWTEQPGSKEFHPERATIRRRLDRLKDITGTDGGVRYPEF